MSKRAPPENGWEQAIEDYRNDERILSILNAARSKNMQPDPSISDEMRTLLVFTMKAEQKARKINGPQDLENAQQSLNEIQTYRDRATEICLDCMARKGVLDHYERLANSIITIRPEVQTKTEGVRKAVLTYALEELIEAIAKWDSIKDQAELVVKNCRDAYFTIQAQAEIAKLMWYRDNRVDFSANPSELKQRG